MIEESNEGFFNANKTTASYLDNPRQLNTLTALTEFFDACVKSIYEITE